MTHTGGNSTSARTVTIRVIGMRPLRLSRMFGVGGVRAGGGGGRYTPVLSVMYIFNPF